MIPPTTRRGLNSLLRRTLLAALILTPSIYVWQHRLRAPDRDPARPTFDLAEYPYDTTSNTTVNLVLATVAKDDISWTAKLRIPNLNIIRYVSDDATAPFRPPVFNKGREALMYHTYLHDFYDKLPDVSILIHAHETPWHADSATWASMLFALSRLDVGQVAASRGGYASLRLSWYQACPAWINTTKTPEESDKQEEPFMAAAFRANFGDDVAVPEILAGACCSQFAVTREAVRRRRRDEYARMRDWLANTDWSDYIAGRTWERMWPWLFKEQARDCPDEWRAYCAMYGVCFASDQEMRTFQALWTERQDLREEVGFFKQLWEPEATTKKSRRIEEAGWQLEDTMWKALERGQEGRAKKEAGAGLYSL